MNIREKLPVLEAVLFAGGEPVELDKICLSMEVSEDEALELISMLKEKYSSEDSGIELLQLNSSFQLAAKKAMEIAEKTAGERGSTFIGSEHMLYGFLSIPTCSAYRLLASEGVYLSEYRERLYL